MALTDRWFSPRLANTGARQGGAQGNRLNLWWWVDAFSSTPNPNGSVNNPYPNLQAAIDAAAAFGVFAFVLAGGVYGPALAGEGGLQLSGLGGIAGPRFTRAPDCNGAISTSGTCGLQGVAINSTVDAGALEADGCYFTGGNVTMVDPLAVLTNCRFFSLAPTQFTFSGDEGVLQVDSYTNARMTQAGVTVVNGTVEVIG